MQLESTLNAENDRLRGLTKGSQLSTKGKRRKGGSQFEDTKSQAEGEIPEGKTTREEHQKTGKSRRGIAKG